MVTSTNYGVPSIILYVTQKNDSHYVGLVISDIFLFRWSHAIAFLDLAKLPKSEFQSSSARGHMPVILTIYDEYNIERIKKYLEHAK